MKEAERGTHSDEEDAMEFGGLMEGTLEDGTVTSSSQALVGAAKYKGGINSLFNLGAGVLRYESVDLTPGFSIGKLLNPIETSEETTSVKSRLEDHPLLGCALTTRQTDSQQSSTLTESGGKSLSLEGYLVSVRNELGFIDSDVEFARTLYNVISSTGNFGIARQSLKTHPSLSGLVHQLSVNDHIQTLSNFEMVRNNVVYIIVVLKFHAQCIRYTVLESMRSIWCPIPIPISGA